MGLNKEGVMWGSKESGDSLTQAEVGVKRERDGLNYILSNIKITKTIKTIYFNAIIY